MNPNTDSGAVGHTRNMLTNNYLQYTHSIVCWTKHVKLPINYSLKITNFQIFSNGFFLV